MRETERPICVALGGKKGIEVVGEEDEVVVEKEDDDDGGKRSCASTTTARTEFKVVSGSWPRPRLSVPVAKSPGVGTKKFGRQREKCG